MKLSFSVLPEHYGIYQLAANAVIPTPTAHGLWSFIRTADEVSIVCAVGGCPHALKKDEGWSAIKLQGPFDFALIGIAAEVSRVLADARIGIFMLSTFDTDYILVKQQNTHAATHALMAAGHQLLA